MPARVRAQVAVRLRFDIEANAMAVRRALIRLGGDLDALAVPVETRGIADIVLAEALNNIVEHAYAGASGSIALVVEPGPAGLTCTLTDRGAPMPGLCLPEGRLPTPDGEVPEGGFGWFLIRSLACDLRYRRGGGANRLSFRLPASAPGDNPGA